ncbi:MAG: hypothetical protein HQ495_13450 [Alphaproteobacteria bacterium]|nr:hypothetical protein [Alphaproteobacteria bacterium]
MGSLRIHGACAAGIIAMGVGSVSAAEFVAPVYPGSVRPVVDPFRIMIVPGWRAQCRAKTGQAEVTTEKTTGDENGVVLNAQVIATAGSPSAYGVALFFGRDGQAGDVQIEEVSGHPIDDDTYVDLRDSAAAVLPEMEFAGKMTDEIAVHRDGPGPDPAQPLEVAVDVAVDGLTTVGGDDFVIVRREGRMSGDLGGQQLAIRFAGFTRIHRASGLIAEQVLETELRSEGGSPVHDNATLSCVITPNG